MRFFKDWVAGAEWLRKHIPTPKVPQLKSLNFILLHYSYLILLAIIGSIILYPAKNMPYIDALFFASGAATQSGLNTVDVNTIYLYQQIALYFMACIANPIFINTFVVFVRLYWFEKRFQGVVKEARHFRRTGSRSFSKSQAKPDLDHEERGVGNRPIVVQRHTNGQAVGQKPEIDMTGSEITVLGGSEELKGKQPEGLDEKNEASLPHRDIMFADEIKRQDHQVEVDDDRLPERRTREQHIAFVVNQRNPETRRTLRIPGPRDYDAGYVPEQVDENDENALGRRITNNADPAHPDHRAGEFNMDDHPLKDHDHDGTGTSRGKLARGLAHLHIGRPPSASSRENADSGIRNRTRSRTINSFLTSRSQEKESRDPLPYLSYAATIGRNSTFIDLTEDQRDELGGIEYRALKTLAVVLICYFIGFHVLGIVVLMPWLSRSKEYGPVVTQWSQNKIWWGIFTPASMFNDLGFTLTPDSMMSFQTAVLPLLFGSFLIVIGNTGFPCMLRFVIWVASKCVTRGSPLWEELRFLLDHPRRCFTLLFPSRATWWLFFVLVVLNTIDLILFIVLDLNDSTVTSISPGYRVVSGIFQAFSTRTAGFAVVNLAELHPGIQVSYLIMMYISVFPIAISVRKTNVYEEKSLGVYAGDDEDDNSGQASYVGAHLRRQLSFDLWYIFLGLFFIAIIEGSRIENVVGDDASFTQFSILFEIISAYGTVGLSLGFPNTNASFSAQFHTLSKLIIIAMQIRGRHRGLPYALDRAILLPSESLQRKEQEDAARRAARRSSTADFVDGSAHTAAMQAAALQAAANNALTKEGTNTTATTNDERRRIGLTRILTGALSAGPMNHQKRH